ncbi:STAS domain-containing protein [Geodermatophilus sp. SYSU D00710]
MELPRPDGRDTQESGAAASASPRPGEACFTEAIDRRTGRIRARGRLDGRAADMLRGTVDALRQGGCSGVVLDLGGVPADAAAVDAVRSLEEHVAAEGGRVALVNWPG